MGLVKVREYRVADKYMLTEETDGSYSYYVKCTCLIEYGKILDAWAEHTQVILFSVNIAGIVAVQFNNAVSFR
jgi:hypothetical protein